MHTYAESKKETNTSSSVRIIAYKCVFMYVHIFYNTKMKSVKGNQYICIFRTCVYTY